MTFSRRTHSSMAVGLGMSQDEWKDMRSKVDNSFWVMRIIGMQGFDFNIFSRYRTTLQVIHLYYPTMMDSHVAPISAYSMWLNE